MRIAIVYDCLFPNTVGGAERWYRNLAERLGERDEITYLTRRQWGEEGPGTSFETLAVSPRRRALHALRPASDLAAAPLRARRLLAPAAARSPLRRRPQRLLPLLLTARREARPMALALASPPDRRLARGLGAGLLALVSRSAQGSDRIRGRTALPSATGPELHLLALGGGAPAEPTATARRSTRLTGEYAGDSWADGLGRDRGDGRQAGAARRLRGTAHPREARARDSARDRHRSRTDPGAALRDPGRRARHRGDARAVPRARPGRRRRAAGQGRPRRAHAPDRLRLLPAPSLRAGGLRDGRCRVGLGWDAGDRGARRPRTRQRSLSRKA